MRLGFAGSLLKMGLFKVPSLKFRVACVFSSDRTDSSMGVEPGTTAATMAVSDTHLGAHETVL